MNAQESVVLDGTTYVRADMARCERMFPQVDQNLSYTAAELESLTGVNRQSLYRAEKAGRLMAIYPNGTKRGMRFYGLDFLDWIAGSRSAASPTGQSS